MSLDEEGYNGWSNRATWAMSLNISNDETTYRITEGAARFAAIGNEDSVEDFRAELAEMLRIVATDWVDNMPFLLPDFDPAGHESPDPKDPHGPDDIEEVNWDEIAAGYVLADYV